MQLAVREGRLVDLSAKLERRQAEFETRSLDDTLNIAVQKRAFHGLKRSGVQVISLVFHCLIGAWIQCGDTAAALEYFKIAACPVSDSIWRG